MGTTQPTAAVELLRDFVNTYDVEVDLEVLTTPAELTRWLRDRQLLGEPATASGADLRTALELRAGLREAMARHHDGASGSSTTLDALGRRLPLRVGFAGELPRLEPVEPGAPGALARILAAVVDSQAEDTWRRLKLCPASDCLWAFYDTSKNQSRQWCTMRVCGNRQKTRAYRTRRRDQAESTR